MTYTYDDLHFYGWMLDELKKRHNAKPEQIEKIENRIFYIKRQIRQRNRAEAHKETVVKDDGDNCIVKFPLPEDIQSEEEAREWFRENEYIEYRPTYYDCTGQLFTSWYKIFQKPDGRFWAYHSIGRDV